MFLAAYTFLDPNLRATGVATPTITPRVVQPTPGAIVTLQATLMPTGAGSTPTPNAASTSKPTALDSPSPTAMVTLSP